MDSKTEEKEPTKAIVRPYDIDNVKNMTRAESGLLWPLLICGVSELIVRFCLSSRVRERKYQPRVPTFNSKPTLTYLKRLT